MTEYLWTSFSTRGSGRNVLACASPTDKSVDPIRTSIKRVDRRLPSGCSVTSYGSHSSRTTAQ